jgi:hypothetical protein
MTSELSRNLYNNNISLEEKHKAFLARLPTPSAMTPRTTPSSSPVPTPEYRPVHLPRVRNFHARRISVSPSDLALLADQNAELLQKLEKLETESTQANLAGRRRLGKLEKEIDGLREELDQYRTQSDALQSQVVACVDEEARRRRQEWTERVKAHRSNKSGSSWSFGIDDAEGSGAVRDFAPHGSGSGRPSAVLKMSLPVAPDTDTAPHHMDSGSPAKDARPLPPLTPQRSPVVATVHPPTGETALVAQLVSKVRELELTNEQILASQRDTATKLQEAQIEAEGIRRLYAFLDEQKDVELEVVEDDGENEDQPAQDPSAPIRFRSLRRSIHGGLRELSAPAFEKGTESDKDATVSSAGTDLIKGPPLKARKTVVGLFDTPSQSARDGTEPAMMISNPSSPALSSLDLPAGSLFSRQASHGPTLGSELGSDYGDDYVENHHLRSSSLYDVFLSGPSATSRPATPATPLADIQPLSDQLQDEPQPLPSKPSQDLDKTPQKPSPRMSHRDHLSNTIRARTNYWVDRRFHHTAPVGRLTNRFEAEGGNGLSDGSALASRPGIAQAAVQTMPCEEDVAVVKADKVLALQRAVDVPEPEPKRGRAMRVIIELWLWLQFFIIIMVFLFAVAKRGPRSVLGNTASRTVKRIE